MRGISSVSASLYIMTSLITLARCALAGNARCKQRSASWRARKK